MTNEQMVEEIRNGVSVTENMERLYLNNLPLIKKFIKPYTSYESEEDLLQEAYFGLAEAIQRYETSENVLFMTYAQFWIRQQIKKYIENCRFGFKIPRSYIWKINRYKKSIQEYQQIYRETPTDQDMADFMDVSVDEIQKIRFYAADIKSIDAPIQDSDGLSLSDTLGCDFSLENTIVDKIYEGYQEKELWDIVERYTDTRQQEIIRQHFQEGKTISEIARESGQNFQAVRTQKEKALRKLQMGRAGRELREKFEVIEASAYRAGVGQFKHHDDTSVVEHIAIRRMEIERQYNQAIGV